VATYSLQGSCEHAQEGHCRVCVTELLHARARDADFAAERAGATRDLRAFAGRVRQVGANARRLWQSLVNELEER
jgi:hypothetical protein